MEKIDSQNLLSAFQLFNAASQNKKGFVVIPSINGFDVYKVDEVQLKLFMQQINALNTVDTIKDKTICPNCGKRHPLVAEFGYCGKCAQEMYDVR